MKAFYFHAELWLPRPCSEVFEFFSNALNLQAITPDWLKFEVLTPPLIKMGVGTQIDYRIRLRGFPIRWRTEIVEWNPPHGFVDVQLEGPYRLWRHTHRFEARDGGTLCSDDVRYSPRGGALVNWLFVRRDIQRIFDYRRERLFHLLGPNPH